MWSGLAGGLEEGIGGSCWSRGGLRRIKGRTKCGGDGQCRARDQSCEATGSASGTKLVYTREVAIINQFREEFGTEGVEIAKALLQLGRGRLG